MNFKDSTGCEEGNMDRNAPSLDLDLNNLPPGEEIQGQGNGHSQEQRATNDVEASDDDVVIISPTKFAEAKKYSRRRRYGIELPREALTGWLFLNNARHTTPNDQTPIRSEPGQNFQEFNQTQNVVTGVPMAPSPQSKPAISPTFICGICMDQLTEETSTKCGHIFCKKCIEVAIATQKKCPTCRQKLKKRDIIRVYLPTSS
ncbi:uncharacterized protein LOC133819861 [Humulus lupulus]|uniref:uncharacterized protein LOC133819861 n=1 Tax=Humulus lupulus TaxID=3486 RepID=UPI002B415FF2|nr:uncharacterized protein LOC133819861 [Humulus lupulus]XP_062109219.1 uncharacterized protein LOC133819861 [Humulus lupulus]